MRKGLRHGFGIGIHIRHRGVTSGEHIVRDTDRVRDCNSFGSSLHHNYSYIYTNTMVG